jgi:hypothetical protein
MIEEEFAAAKQKLLQRKKQLDAEHVDEFTTALAVLLLCFFFPSHPPPPPPSLSPSLPLPLPLFSLSLPLPFSFSHTILAHKENSPHC